MKPIVHRAWDGRDIVLPDDPTVVLRAADDPALREQIGHDIITASGSTLLGADNKAGVAEIMAAADSVDTGDGVVVVTDMFGGSPSNLSLKACVAGDRQIIYGANLPMWIKLAKSRSVSVPDAVASALEAGRKYINSYVGSGQGSQ